MQILLIAFSHLCFLALIAVLALATTTWRRDILTFYYNRIVFQNNLSRRDYYRVEMTLSKHMSYFDALSTEGKARFIQRVQDFSRRREFVGMNGLKVTREMRLLISASAVQLTFGLRDFNIRFLEEIRIYPEPFYNRFMKTSLKGAVSPSGFLLVSWKDFLAGYADDNDNMNLGLHEMAHALKLDISKSDIFDFRVGAYLDNWFEVSHSDFTDLRQGRAEFLRRYGGNNRHEFFAVCVEHFFESPQVFSEKMPDVYNHLCKLLNQNPLNAADDYRVSAQFKHDINSNPERVPLPKVIRKEYPVDFYSRFHLFIAATLFSSLVIDVVWGFDTLINWKQLGAMGFAGAALAGSLQWKYLTERKPLRNKWWFLFGVALFAFSCNIYLLANWFFAVDREVRYHQVESVYFEEGHEVLRLEDRAYADNSKLRNVRLQAINKRTADGLVAYHFRRGCMGMLVLEYIRFVEPDIPE